MLHGLGVEMAEALAELWHHRIRERVGLRSTRTARRSAGLFRQQYRGGRYSWGYPACPDLEDNATVATLLGAERIGVEVGEDTGWQYQPEQTTSAIICHHPRPSTSSPAEASCGRRPAGGGHGYRSPAMNIFAWIIVGLIAGLLARWIVRDERSGCLYTIAVGVIGALIGGALMNASGHKGVNDFDLRSILVAALGAVLLLLVLQAIGGRRRIGRRRR